MATMIERPEDEIQHMIGRLIWENTVLRHQVEQLSRQIEQLQRDEKHAENDPNPN